MGAIVSDRPHAPHPKPSPAGEEALLEAPPDTGKPSDLTFSPFGPNIDHDTWLDTVVFIATPYHQ